MDVGHLQGHGKPISTTIPPRKVTPPLLTTIRGHQFPSEWHLEISHFYSGNFTLLTLCRSCVGNHSCWGSLCRTPLPCPEVAFHGSPLHPLIRTFLLSSLPKWSLSLWGWLASLLHPHMNTNSHLPLACWTVMSLCTNNYFNAFMIFLCSNWWQAPTVEGPSED